MEKQANMKLAKLQEKAFSYFYIFVPKYKLLMTEKKDEHQQI